jgi:predicted DNA-binding protein (UPF0251 family)
MSTLLTVFEDKAIPPDYLDAIAREVDVRKDLDLYGSTDKLEWHSTWNALGDAQSNSRLIRSHDDFREALRWCQTYTGRAICFFDFQLPILITEVDLVSVGDVSKRIVGKATYLEALAIYNTDTQGLLLALALSQNRQADVDIILASTEALRLRDYKTFLQQNAVRGIFVNLATSTLSKASKAFLAAEVVVTAIADFEGARPSLGSDDSFWPMEGDNWFVTTGVVAPFPHNHPHFERLSSAEKRTAIGYLCRMGASEDISEKWLRNFGVYETLKHFVGGYAVAHGVTSRRKLTLGSLVFPLLKATSGEGWADTLAWLDFSSDPILDADKPRSRQLILAALRLFRALTLPRTEGADGNRVNAEFLTKPDGTHFVVDVSFDGSVGYSKEGRPASGEVSFCSKILAFPWVVPSGDAAEALYDVMQYSFHGNGSRTLLLAVYPVEIGEAIWTRFDFKVKPS